jgi:hypothetical protein
MAISARDGITELTGSIIDPAHFHGLLERIAGLRLKGASLTPLDADPYTSRAGVGEVAPAPIPMDGGP